MQSSTFRDLPTELNQRNENGHYDLKYKDDNLLVFRKPEPNLQFK